MIREAAKFSSIYSALACSIGLYVFLLCVGGDWGGRAIMVSVVVRCVATEHPCPNRDNVLLPKMFLDNNYPRTCCFCSVRVGVGWRGY